MPEYLFSCSNMTPVEIFALIVALIVLIKLFVILKNPGTWLDVVETIWKNPNVVIVVSFVLAIVVLYYLLQEITIVQVFSVMLLFVLLSAVNIAMYSKEFMQFGRRLLKQKNLIRRSWFSILIWVILTIWVIKELI